MCFGHHHQQYYHGFIAVAVVMISVHTSKIVVFTMFRMFVVAIMCYSKASYLWERYECRLGGCQ